MPNQNIKILFLREIRNYFNTPIGYVFAVTCLFFNFLFFFLGLAGIIPEFWTIRQASIRGYLDLLPVTFILLVPAISMRIWAEEYKTGTIELLSSLPFKDRELVLGKFLAAWSVTGGLVLASIPLALSIWALDWGKSMDLGVTMSMYLGSLLMAGAYVAVGMVISALTREQIVAFILLFFISLLMFISNYFIVSQHLPPMLGRLLGFFSLSYHFSSFSRGLLDLGDIVYYVSFITLMLTVNIWILRRER